LFILAIIAMVSLPSWCFYVGLFWLILWMVAKHKQTGDVPRMSDEIDRFFVEGRKRRRRKRRR